MSHFAKIFIYCYFYMADDKRIPSRALLRMGKHFLVQVFTNEINPGQKRFHYNLVGFQATAETARGLKT